MILKLVYPICGNYCATFLPVLASCIVHGSSVVSRHQDSFTSFLTFVFAFFFENYRDWPKWLSGVPT